MVETVKPTLGYWKIRGLAQQIRYMFALAKVEFTEDLYEVVATPEGGWDRSAWNDKKFTLGLDYPNLPYLFDGDYKLTETVAIMRYVAAKWAPEMLGTTPEEQANLVMMTEHVGQLKSSATGPCYTGGSRETIVDTCRPILAGISKWLGEREYFGNTVTFLDVFFYELCELTDLVSEGKFYAEFPNTKAHHDRIHEIPALKEYRAKQDAEHGVVPFNNPMASIGA